jgi:hypothetical protein
MKRKGKLKTAFESASVSCGSDPGLSVTKSYIKYGYVALYLFKARGKLHAFILFIEEMRKIRTFMSTLKTMATDPGVKFLHGFGSETRVRT